MTNSRPRVSGRDVAGAGALMLAVNAVCAAAGAGIGVLAGLLVPMALVGFGVGFFLGIYVVAKRVHEI
jgi:hypothetical protein